MPDRFKQRASPGRERPSLLVHLFVDCIDTLHRARPVSKRVPPGRAGRIGRRAAAVVSSVMSGDLAAQEGTREVSDVED
jgi:hypothetical protein